MTVTTYRGRGRPRKTDTRNPKKTGRHRKGKPTGIRPFDQKGLDDQDAQKSRGRTARSKMVRKTVKISADNYVHKNEKRKNIPETGLFANFKDDDKTRKYRYDPNQDPTLGWAGKTEQQEFEVDTVPLHMHERVDPMTLILNLRPDPLLFFKPTHPAFQAHFRQAARSANHNSLWFTSPQTTSLIRSYFFSGFRYLSPIIRHVLTFRMACST